MSRILKPTPLSLGSFYYFNHCTEETSYLKGSETSEMCLQGSAHILSLYYLPFGTSQLLIPKSILFLASNRSHSTRATPIYSTFTCTVSSIITTAPLNLLFHTTITSCCCYCSPSCSPTCTQHLESRVISLAIDSLCLIMTQART